MNKTLNTILFNIGTKISQRFFPSSNFAQRRALVDYCLKGRQRGLRIIDFNDKVTKYQAENHAVINSAKSDLKSKGIELLFFYVHKDFNPRGLNYFLKAIESPRINLSLVKKALGLFKPLAVVLHLQLFNQKELCNYLRKIDIDLVSFDQFQEAKTRYEKGEANFKNINVLNIIALYKDPNNASCRR